MFYTWDARNNIISGPYERVDEILDLVQRLNRQAAVADGFPVLAIGVPSGPFWVKTAEQAARLNPKQFASIRAWSE